MRTSAEKPDDEAWPRELSRRSKSGELLRIRQGCYVDALGWGQLEDEERYRGMLAAMTLTSRKVPLFGAESAGLLWGLPRPTLPADVQVIVPAQSGRKSSNGVRRLTRDPAAVTTAEVDGVLVTGKVQTAVDLAILYDFPWAVAVMDRLLNTKPLPGEIHSKPVTKAEVETRIDLLVSGAKRRRARRVLEFASGLAMYPGESLSRVHMAQLGFPAPVLQHQIIDARGHVATVDFYWEDYQLVGEFDGRGKYMKPEYLMGRTPAQVVIDEKNRENRIRATGVGVVRWEWPTAQSPEALARELTSAGLPQRGKYPASGPSWA